MRHSDRLHSHLPGPVSVVLIRHRFEVYFLWEKHFHAFVHYTLVYKHTREDIGKHTFCLTSTLARKVSRGLCQAGRCPPPLLHRQFITCAWIPSEHFLQWSLYVSSWLCHDSRLFSHTNVVGFEVFGGEVQIQTSEGAAVLNCWMKVTLLKGFRANPGFSEEDYFSHADVSFYEHPPTPPVACRVDCEHSAPTSHPCKQCLEPLSEYLLRFGWVHVCKWPGQMLRLPIL